MGTINVYICDRMLVYSIISPRRLMEGGADILIINLKNQNKEKEGKMDIIPLHKNILRELKISYDMLARANIAGEHNPWPTIIMRAPHHPIKE
jgi:hypothetical protein